MNATPPGWQPHQPHAEPGAGNVPVPHLELRESRIRLIWLFVLGIIMTGLSVAGVVAGVVELHVWSVLAGVIGVPFFGAGIVIIVVRFVKPATLIADEHGVHETAWPRKTRTIRWDEVVRFFPRVVDNQPRGKRLVCIEFTSSGMHHTDDTVRRLLHYLADFVGGGDQLDELADSGVHYFLSSYPVPADQLAGQLEQLRLRYTATR